MSAPTTTTPATWTLLLWGDPEACPDLAAAYGVHDRFAQDCAAQGHEIVGGEELAAGATARVLRAAPDGAEIMDGPYAETTEQLGGFYLIRTADPDGLLRLAEPLLMGDPAGVLELRPVVVHDQAPVPVEAGALA